MAKDRTEWGDMETVAAIAWNMGISENWRQAYEAARDHMGGFPGFYQASVEMATTLEDYARAKKLVWGEGADWLITTENVAKAILEFMIKMRRLPLENERISIVRKNISFE